MAPPHKPMTCPTCKQETYRITRFESGHVQCPNCPKKHVPAGTLDFKGGSFANSSSGKMTAAHRDNIERRRLAPDGEVYIDRGRKSFMLR